MATDEVLLARLEAVERRFVSASSPAKKCLTGRGLFGPGDNRLIRAFQPAIEGVVLTVFLQAVHDLGAPRSVLVVWVRAECVEVAIDEGPVVGRHGPEDELMRIV